MDGMLKDQGILHQASFILYLLISSFNIRYSIFFPHSPAICSICPLHVLPVQLHATGDQSHQCHFCQPGHPDS